MTDELDVEMSAQEIFVQGERRIRERRASGGYPEYANPALRDLILENRRLQGIIEAQEFLLNNSKPKNEVCQCESTSPHS